jgi:tetratricopeptide (TPR) repeat protein
MRRILSAVCLAALAAAVPLRAQHAGHGAGDSVAGAGFGAVDFPTSAAPAARAPFLRGVLYLHNFHYPMGAQAFQEAQRLDPGDVMSFWGEAMTYTHPIWNEQDTARARAVLRRLAPTPEARAALARTERERMYLEAVEALYGEGSKAARDTAFSQAMGRLHARFPDDVEAASFYALSLLGLNQGDREPQAYARAADIAEAIFRSNPNHPGGAHYLIHAVDDPEHAARGLDAARAYSQIAPRAAHAQHMTSHIFIAVGNWDDVVRANEQAAAVSNPNAPARFGHGTHWLIYALAQQKRLAESRALADSMAAQLARIPRGAPGFGFARSYGVPALAAYVVDAGDWDSPHARIRVDTAELGWWASPLDFAAGYAALRRGDMAVADSLIGVLAARDGEPENRPGYAASDRGYTRVMEGTLRALRLHAAGDADSALALLRAAGELEASLPMAFGPPVTVKPPYEVLGELLLLELGRPAEAVVALEQALARTPARPAVLLALARAHRAPGHRDEAVRRYAELAAVWRHAPADAPDVAEARAGAEGRW